MAISIASLRKVKVDQPPRVLIYGPPKMGKTTLASEFPAPVFLQTEQGESGGLELDSFGHLQTYAEVDEALISLFNETHAFATLVVDSLSELEKLIIAEACKRNGWKNIEQPGYGKGYVAADAIWQEFLTAINMLRSQRGMAVVLIAHASIERFDDPQTQSYSRYDIDLHKNVRALMQREVDAILLVKQDVSLLKEKTSFGGERAIGTGASRWIYCEGSPAYTAGNRYNMPDKLLFQPGKGFAALAPYFPQPAAGETAPAKKEEAA